MDIIDQIKPAIVAILLPIDEQNAKPNGTGFFITSDGYILTCYHVVQPLIESSTPIKVKTKNGTFEANYVKNISRIERVLDWAVLKVNSNIEFPCLRLSDECNQGDEWCTIGYELSERADGIPNMGDIVGKFDRIEAASRDINLHSINSIRGGVSGSPVFNKKNQLCSRSDKRSSQGHTGFCHFDRICIQSLARAERFELR